MSDMRTTTDLHGDNLFYSVGSISWNTKANGVDGNAIWITISERTVGMQGIEGIIFIVFGEENWIICGNPSIDAIFNTLELFRSEFAIDIEVKTQALRSEVTAFLVNTGVDFFLESGEKEVASGVVFDGLVAGVGETTLEHTLGSSFAAFTLGIESLGELSLVIFGEIDTDFVGFFDAEFEWEAIGILELEEVVSGDSLTGLSHFLELFDTFVDGLAEGVFLFSKNSENISTIWQNVVGELGVILLDDW